ncbi:MAG: hypothetical protein BMS9Abin34_092 [Patescibacteria group bacterium]|nr:MAG: hypothetical protein BMS9Abin34_092 [Patescibacteria group bacterium]
MYLKKHLGELAAAVLVLPGIYLLWQQSLLLSLWILVLIGGLLGLKRSKTDLIVAFSGFLFGVVIEPLAVGVGFETFTRPDFLGVPYWMPFLWSLIFLLARRLLTFREESS